MPAAALACWATCAGFGAAFGLGRVRSSSLGFDPAPADASTSSSRLLVLNVVLVVAACRDHRLAIGGLIGAKQRGAAGARCPRAHRRPVQLVARPARDPGRRSSPRSPSTIGLDRWFQSGAPGDRQTNSLSIAQAYVRGARPIARRDTPADGGDLNGAKPLLYGPDRMFRQFSSTAGRRWRQPAAAHAAAIRDGAMRRAARQCDANARAPLPPSQAPRPMQAASDRVAESDRTGCTRASSKLVTPTTTLYLYVGRAGRSRADPVPAEHRAGRRRIPNAWPRSQCGVADRLRADLPRVIALIVLLVGDLARHLLRQPPRARRSASLINRRRAR